MGDNLLELMLDYIEAVVQSKLKKPKKSNRLSSRMTKSKRTRKRKAHSCKKCDEKLRKVTAQLESAKKHADASVTCKFIDNMLKAIPSFKGKKGYSFFRDKDKYRKVRTTFQSIDLENMSFEEIRFSFYKLLKIDNCKPESHSEFQNENNDGSPTCVELERKESLKENQDDQADDKSKFWSCDKSDKKPSDDEVFGSHSATLL